MGGQQNAGAVGAQILDEVPEDVAGLGVEAGGGLIEEQQLGAADDGQGDIEAAATSSRQARDAGAGVVGESHTIDGLGDVGGPSEKTGRCG